MSAPFEIAVGNRVEQNEKGPKYCGNPRCSTSTGICGATTHGYGELDQTGYWEWPCFVCARHYQREEDQNGGVLRQWPFPPVVALPEDIRRTELHHMMETIETILMDEGNLYIDKLHEKASKACTTGSFDEVFCDLVRWGRVQCIFPGPLAAIANRTRARRTK